jgi:hypothetical protein
MLWNVIPYVTTGVTLAAFLAAVAAWVYRLKIVNKERLIRSASEEDRAELVVSALEFFNVDTGNLTKKQQFDLALTQIHARAHRFLLTSILIAIVFFVAAAITALAIIFVAPRDEGITRTEFQLIDDQTKEPIYRSIGVVFQRSGAPPEPAVVTDNFGKGELKGGFADVQVTTINGDGARGYGDPELDQSGPVPRIRLNRTSSLEFNKSIRPQRDDFDVSQEVYERALRLTADEFPEDVLVRCRNKTPFHVDVFMYRYVPEGLHGGWIVGGTCPPNENVPTTIHRFQRPFTADGYFFIYASVHGMRVNSEPDDEGNLFQSPNPIITVEPSTDPHDPKKITASLSGEFN